MKRFTTMFLLLNFLITLASPSAVPTRAADHSLLPDAAMASIYVTSTADTQANDGLCTLREAILNANADDQSGSTDCDAGNGADIIYFSLSYPATILLSSALPVVTGTLTIQGPGADRLSLDGNNSVGILSVNVGASLTVVGLTFTNGRSGNGAAIFNQGNLSVSQAAFTHNATSASSGAILNYAGMLEVTASSFSGNQASTAGGAIGSFGGAATVTNSTFSGNSVTGAWGGGAIYSQASVLSASTGSDVLRSNDQAALPAVPDGPSAATLVVMASTFSGNTAPGGGGAIGNGGNGGVGGTATIQNSVLGGNLVGSASVNCYNLSGTLTDGGYNLEDADTCAFSGTSLKNTNPLFLGLGNYGGSTQTIAVRSDSPAIDHIPNSVSGCGTTLTTDQRGVARPQGTACDVGAYESDQQLGPTFTVNQVSDSAGVCGRVYCTLRQAITSAQIVSGGGAHTIDFSLTYPATILLGSSLPAITSTLTIQGPGADRLSLDGNSSVGILSVNPSASLTVVGLTFTNGHSGNGAAIFNQGSLSVSQAAFTNNSTSASSGAIINYAGTLEVTTSSFSGNQASTGGGAIGTLGGTATVTNSTFSGNSAAGPWGGGAIYSQATILSASTGSDVLRSNDQAALPAVPDGPSAATLVVMASTFSGNTAVSGGGAIGNGGSGGVGGTATIQNSVLGGNLVGGASVNCYNQLGTLTDGGYNLEDADTCTFSGTSLKNTNPLFLRLGDYGGSTQTVAVRGGSPAIDHIPDGVSGCGTSLTTDQRGVVRPQGTACDVGAYESDQQLGSTFTVNQAGDATGLCGETLCTLRQAINTVQTYPAGTAYTISFNLAYPATILLEASLPAVTSTLTIQGPGADRLTIDGGSGVRMLSVVASASLTVTDLTFANGRGGNGGAILNQGSLSVSRAAFTNNASYASSGAIYNSGGTLKVTASTFTGNQASSAGGAIGNYGGTATVTNSTFSGNSAAGLWGGGAIYARVYARIASTGSDALRSNDQAALPEVPDGPSAATLVVMASTFSGNTAPGGGGAIGNGGNGEAGGTVTIQNSVLGGNLVGGASVNCYNESGTLTDGGYNLEDADTCAFSGTSLKNTDPMLLGLGYYGGNTMTIAIGSDSPAFNHIPNSVSGCGTTLTTDQRGVVRPQGTACDVGAFEFASEVYLPLLKRGN